MLQKGNMTAEENCWNHLYANHSLCLEDCRHGVFYVTVSAELKSSSRECTFAWDNLQSRAAFAAWANEAIREGWKITTIGKVFDENE